jgi:predicted dehydrogenase
VTPRIALVGAGAWGRNLLRLAHQRGALAAVVDPDPLARSQSPCQAFPSLRELLRHGPSLDAALVASPARTHFSASMEALDSNLDLLVEKPLTVSSAEGEALVQRATQRGRVAMVGHLLRYHPAIERLLDEVRRGSIGPPRELHSWRRSPPGRGSDVSVLWALAPHDLSLLLALEGGECLGVAGKVSWEQASVQLRCGSGLRVNLRLSRCHPVKERRLWVLGPEGALSFDDLAPDAPLRFHRAGSLDGPGEPVAVPQREPLAAELDHFLECIEHRKTPRTPASDGLAVVRWLEAIEALGTAEDTRPPLL